MEFDGDALIIDLGMGMDEIKELEEFLRSKLDYVSSIVIRDKNASCSGALLALLASVKKSAPTVSVEFFEGGEFFSQLYGAVDWRCHE